MNKARGGRRRVLLSESSADDAESGDDEGQKITEMAEILEKNVRLRKMLIDTVDVHQTNAIKRESVGPSHSKAASRNSRGVSKSVRRNRDDDDEDDEPQDDEENYNPEDDDDEDVPFLDQHRRRAKLVSSQPKRQSTGNNHPIRGKSAAPKGATRVSRANPVDEDGAVDSDDEPIYSPSKTANAKSQQKATIVRKRAAPTRTKGNAPRRTRRAKAEEDGEDDNDLEEEAEPTPFKEGQIKGDGQRAFYESLLEENPDSIIAIKYCVEQGVLMGTKAKEALRKYHALKAFGAFKPTIFGGKHPELLRQALEAS